MLADGRRSPLLGSFGCLERRNITVIMESIASDVRIRVADFGDGDVLFQSLDDPCHTIFLYNFHSRKFFQWRNGASQIVKEFDRSQKISSETQYLELLHDLRHSFESNNATQQILLFQYTPYMSPSIARALERMHKETLWNIIVQCTFGCPVLPQFPLHRIITVFERFELSRHVRDLVRNPNFDKMEWLKQMKTDGDKVTKLQNRNIHILDLFLSLSVMHQVVSISYNTGNTNTKIILHHYTRWNKEFWDSFMSRSGFKNSNIEHVFGEKGSRDYEDKCYVIGDKELSLWFYLILVDIRCSLFIGNKLRNDTVFFVSPTTNMLDLATAEQEFKEMFRKCRLLTKNIYDVFYYHSNYDFVHNFVENLVKRRFPEKHEELGNKEL